MVSVCFYFQVHQPMRIKKYTVFDIGNHHDYFDDSKNREIIERVAKKCYLPANKVMLDLIDEHKGKFKISYSISGIFLEQAKKFAPDVIKSFQKLAKTGCVEFLSETYYHSLSFLYSRKEFGEQVAMHSELMKKLFDYEPKVFRNTELIYNNELAKHVEEMGFKGILAEGADHVLGWRSPNFLYRPANTSSIKLLLKNYKLSDDVAFRFSNQGWKEFPLTADKFSHWVSQVNGNGTNVDLFMDYETIGEHQWAQTGIFQFIKNLPKEIFKHKDNCFMTPSEVIDSNQSVAELDIPFVVSWADVERDLSAWLGNKMQQSAINEIYAIENMIRSRNDKALIEDWRRMQTSDHFYYMCTKWFADGDVHKYFNPYDTPYDGFISYMNVLNDLILRMKMKK
ncbi:glycoside hydrolase family 57 protein [Candidatus Woesearchaeota archaeon]|nr:glycoside hydrolase family 57 protein [Candidatus Woesearchaeota archaeon]